MQPNRKMNIFNEVCIFLIQLLFCNIIMHDYFDYKFNVLGNYNNNNSILTIYINYT